MLNVFLMKIFSTFIEVTQIHSIGKIHHRLYIGEISHDRICVPEA